jgi:hypothetical protein
MADLACTWTDYFNLVDFEGVHVGMFDLVGSRVPFTWSAEVTDVACVWVDRFNLINTKGLSMEMVSLVGSNLPFTSTEVLDVVCTWFDHFNLLDLEGLAICTSSLVGCNLAIRFYCKGDSKGLIVILAIASSCKIHAIWDSGVMALVGSN